MFFRYLTGRTKQYHSGNGKPVISIFAELLKWEYKEHYFNKMYFAFGLNRKNTLQDDYTGRRTFLKIKDEVEYILKRKAGCKDLNYDIITKDKFFANSIFNANGIPAIENMALIKGNHVLFNDGSRKSLESLLELHGIFYIKNTVLEAGDGIITLDTGNKTFGFKEKKFTIDHFKQIIADKIWIVQEQHHSHKEIKKINATALNTTRIVTIMNGTEPEYLSGFQAFATNDSTNDSWNTGSVYVGIDPENNCLKEFGYYSLHVKNKSLCTSHPDSGIVFKGYKIPFLKEAIELCLKAHQLLYFNFVIGWDVAITDKGPVIVEANEKPGMNAVQCVDGGLKRKIMHNASKYIY